VAEITDEDKTKQKIVIDVGDGAAIPSKEDVGLFTAWRVSFVGAVSIVAYLVIF